MKYLIIENGQVFFRFEESEESRKSIDTITKEDILRLLQAAIEDENFEMDIYDDSTVHNTAHKIIYKNIYQKLDDLFKRRISFTDEKINLYLAAIDKYTME